MRELLRHPTGLAGVLLLGIVLVAAVFGSWLAPYDPQLFHPMARLQGPTAAHWLGTDQFGRDVLSRIIHGSRTSLLVSAAAVLAALAVWSQGKGCCCSEWQWWCLQWHCSQWQCWCRQWQCWCSQWQCCCK